MAAARNSDALAPTSADADLRRFRAALDLSGEAVFIVSRRSMTIVDVNQAACRQLGYSRGELIGAPPEMVLPAAREAIAAMYDRLLAEPGARERIERLHRRKDGSTFPVEIERSSVVVEGEQYIVAIARDVTERVRTLRQLAQLRDAVENLHESVCLCDAQDRIVFTNAAFREMNRAVAEDAEPGRPFEDHVRAGLRLGLYPDAAGREEAWFAERMSARRACTPLEFQDRDGRWRRVSDQRFADGSTLTFGLDITGRVAAEQRNAALVQALGEVVYEWYPGQDRIDWLGVEAVLGYSPAEMGTNSASWLDRVHPDDLARVKEEVDLVIRERRNYRLEYRFRHRDGSWRWMHDSGVPRFSADGELERILGVFADITPRKAAEERLRALNRVHAVMSGINALIVRVRERDELFSEACRIAVEDGGFRMAWIGLHDRERSVVTPVASAGAVGDFFDDAPLAVVEGQGLAGRAVRAMKPMVSNDVRAGPERLLRKKLEDRGINSLAVLPLVIDGEAIGVLALYAPESGAFDAAELKLLGDLAGDISFAIAHIDKSKRIAHLAYYDELTGLANRSLLHERLAEEVRSLGAEGRLSLLMLNIDRFKSINDAYGRRSGDRVLRKVAQRLADALGDATPLSRVGADVFAVLLPRPPGEAETARLAERLLAAVFDRPIRLAQGEVRASGRFGIAEYPADARDGDTLFHRAEAAMKRAKTQGQRYLFYTAAMTERTAEKLSLEARLRRALDNDEFVLHYQPKVAVASGELTGMEALIRWQNPDLGLVPPRDFVPLMEETGLILQAGNWALRRAALDHRAWSERGLKPPRVAVNVSPVQLRQHDFVGQVEQALHEGVAPAGVDLEITESLVMADATMSAEKLARLRALGVRIAIDDFGTGYSSLAYLARLPVHTLKIDRSFIDRMAQDADTMTLVQTIISLAHSLRLGVVAEGVEAEEQARFLRLLRCDEMQGYLVSRPIPFAEMTVRLEARHPGD